MRASMRACVIAFLCVLCACVAWTQVATSTYAYGSFDNLGFDTVNRGNLNVHFSIPVVNKAGRGMPFTYNLSYDSSIWTTQMVNGATVWAPVQNFGWRGDTEVVTGFMSFNSDSFDAGPGGGTSHSDECPQTNFSNFVYHDTFGVAHPFPSVGTQMRAGGSCGNPVATSSQTAIDGSGYTLSVTNFSSCKITAPGGTAIAVPNINNGASTITDSNGNQISVDDSGNFTDTLGMAVLQVTGSAPNPHVFSYTNPLGSSSAYTMNYTTYTLATNFGVSGVTEFGATSVSLVSSISLPDGSGYVFSYEPTPGSSCTPLSGTFSGNCVTGRIASVTLPTGGRITYEYSGGNNGIESDGSMAGLTRTDSTGAEWQYTRTLDSGTPGNGSTWTTEVTDPSQNVTVAQFSQDSAQTNIANIYPTETQVYQGSISPSNLLQTTTQCYNGNFGNCAGATITTPFTQIDTYTQLPSGVARLSQIQYNSFGLATDDKEYNFGVALGAAPNVTPIRDTATVYNPVTASGIASEMQSVTVTDLSGGTAVALSSATYAYDGVATTATSGTPNHVAVSGGNGNLTQVTYTTGSATTLTTSYTYFDTGTVNTWTGVNGATTSYVYGSSSCGNSFVTTVNEPTSAANTVPLSTSAVWNCSGGVQTQATDVSGNTVTTTYNDPNFWRPSQTTDQEGNITTIGYNTGSTVIETSLSGFNGGSSAYDFRTSFDVYGRPAFSQQLQGPGAGTYDTTEFDYNSIGQMSRSTMPYSAPGSPSSQNLSAPGTTTTYDALGRPLIVTRGDGGTTAFSYTNNDVLVTVSGSQSFRKQLEYDGLGRLTSVCEVSSSLPGAGSCGQGVAQTGYLTKYTYDALGHRLSVTQNAQSSSGQQSRSFAYDLLGRMTSEANPETGTTHYFWDTAPSGCNVSGSRAGNLAAVETNDGVFVCYAYDALNRMTGYLNSADTNCAGFAYDAPTNPVPTGVSTSNTKGRLVEALTDSACNGINSLLTDEWFSYSPRGETTDVFESTPNSGGYYHSNASYYPTGAVATLSIPGVPTVSYAGLDGEGRYTTASTSSGVSMVTGASYSTSSSSNALGALTGITLASGNTESFKTDPTMSRLTSYTVDVAGSTDTGMLTWNSNGTLGQLAISDGISGTSDSQTCNYAYDDLKRLSSVNCGTLWSQNFSYDAFGNISKDVPSGSAGLTFNPTYNSNNQFSTLPGVTPRYDANGKLLQDNVNSYTWDHYGHLVTASNASSSVTAVYDAFGRQVQNSADGEFVWGPVGASYQAINSGQTLRQAFVPLLGGAQAIWVSSGLIFYRFTDHEGSARIDSKPTGAFFSANAYAPFGEQYATSGAGDSAFTGYGQSTIAGVYDFPLRRLSFSQGRWISPDPAGIAAVHPTNPQSWNRYAYVLNNPAAMVDPMGLDACDPTSAGVPGRPRAADCGGDDGGGDGGVDGGGGGGGGGVNPTPGPPETPAPDPSAGDGAGGDAPIQPCDNITVFCTTGSGTPYPMPDPCDFLGGCTLSSNGPGPTQIGPGGGGLSGSAPNNGQEPPPTCQAKILNATNNQFGTNYTDANVNSTFNYSTGAGPGQGTLNLNISGSTAGVSTGYYPLHWYTYVIGYGSTLHVVSGPGGHGGLDSQQTLPFGPNGGTFHIDSGYPINPIGAAFHWLLNMTKVGGYPKC